MLGKTNSLAKTVTLPMKLRLFGFGVLHGLRVFPNLVFGFPFLSTLMAVFRIFLSNAVTIFLVSPRKLHPAVALKRELYGSLIRGIHDKPSVFSSRYLGRNGCQADYEKLRITLKQKTILKYHAAGITKITVNHFIVSHCYRSVEPIYKTITKF